jgi:hypothetical protein
MAAGHLSAHPCWPMGRNTVPTHRIASTEGHNTAPAHPGGFCWGWGQICPVRLRDTASPAGNGERARRNITILTFGVRV